MSDDIFRDKDIHIDKERGIYLLKFPEYTVDATALIFADTYMTYAYDLIETLNGDRINLGDYLTRKDFYTYYHSFLTEREYTDRIKSYYKKLEINELLDEIKLI